MREETNRSVQPFRQEAWTRVVAAAASEGAVVAYANSVEQVNERLKDDFARAYPQIKLELHRVFGRPIVDRLESERSAGLEGADVVITELLPWLGARAEEGTLHAPCGPAATSWPAEHLLHGVAPVLALDMFVILYNRQLVTEPVASYRDFLRPELKGRFSAPVLSSTAEVAWYNWLEETEGSEFLVQFAAQRPRQGWKLSALPAARAVAAGELAAASFSLLPIARPVQEQGAPIEIVVPKRSTGLRFAGAVLGWAKRPNAGRVLLDYLMSRRGQSAWCGEGPSASPLRGIPGALDAKSINAYDAARYTPEFIAAYRERWERLFGKHPGTLSAAFNRHKRNGEK